MMKIKETRYLYWEELRAFCIRRDYYTLGTNEDYEALYSMLPEVQYREGRRKSPHVTAKDLLKVAKDIMDNSNPACFEIIDLATLVFLINKECCVTTFKIEE